MGIGKFKDLLVLAFVAVNMLGCGDAGEEKGMGYVLPVSPSMEMTVAL